VGRLLVSGLINIETTVRVDRFPIEYEPVRYPFFGIDTQVSGVGYNVAKALTTLGDEVRFLSMIGSDQQGYCVRESLSNDGVDERYVVTLLDHTPQSVILFDSAGRRQINVDLKDIQASEYPLELFSDAIHGCDILALCNINFSRPFLRPAREAGAIIATDVHVVSDLENAYDRDFMEAANILFMSDEGLPCAPEQWVRRIRDRYGAEIVVIGLGDQGALLWVRRDNFIERFASVQTRDVVSTIGAGDALFSAFLHSYVEDNDPYSALEKAMVFASYKIGEAGAAQGFLDADGLDEWKHKSRPPEGYTRERSSA